MRARDALDRMRALPETTLDALVDGTALVLAPHPDDESLGCGGLIASLCDAGRPPVVMIMTDGAFSHPGSVAFPPERLRRVRADEAREAGRVLGLPEDRMRFAAIPDGAAPVSGEGFDAAVDAIEAVMTEFGCSVLLAPWLRDPHGDHEAVQLMARAVVDRGTALRLLSYPIWGWLLGADAELAGEPEPTGWRLPIGPVSERKRQAVQAHRSQCGGLISDDTAGFTLPTALLDACLTAHEVFLADRRS